MMFVLDASAIFSGHIPDGTCLVTPEVYGEIRDTGSKQLIDSYISSGNVRIERCTEKSFGRISEAREKYSEPLSHPDMCSLALAMDTGSTLVTDDYGIQNIARVLSIPYSSAKSKGISKVFLWKWRCIGCRKVYDNPSDTGCDICGSPLRKFRVNKR